MRGVPFVGRELVLASRTTAAGLLGAGRRDRGRTVAAAERCRAADPMSYSAPPPADAAFSSSRLLWRRRPFTDRRPGHVYLLACALLRASWMFLQTVHRAPCCVYHTVRIPFQSAFLFLFPEVQSCLHNLKISHLGFFITWILVVQMSQGTVGISSSCFCKNSILSGPFKTRDTYIDDDIFYFLVKYVSVAIRCASVDSGKSLLDRGVVCRLFCVVSSDCFLNLLILLLVTCCGVEMTHSLPISYLFVA